MTPNRYPVLIICPSPISMLIGAQARQVACPILSAVTTFLAAQLDGSMD